MKVVPEEALEKRVKKSRAEEIIWSLEEDIRGQGSFGETRLETGQRDGEVSTALMQLLVSAHPFPSDSSPFPSCRCLTAAVQGETHLSPFLCLPFVPLPAAAGADKRSGSHREGTAAITGASASSSQKTF